MAQQRYDMQREPDGLWSVVDRYTGWPAQVDGREATGMDMEEADDLLDLLNLLDLRRRGQLTRNHR